MSRFRTLVLLALLALASIARGEGVRLLAPAAGTTLRGGSSAELHWSASRLPADTEEWEAFLSVDGGRYYGFRVTPHLDIALQRFTFVVPNVDARDARILIRTGDEERETHFEIPGSFSIVRDDGAEPVAPHVFSADRGEAAREGDLPVISWAAGARNGSGITQKAAPPARSSSLVRHELTPGELPEVEDGAANDVAGPTKSYTLATARARHAYLATRLARTTDLLLVCRRRNI
jgi:hypothetical protein